MVFLKNPHTVVIIYEDCYGDYRFCDNEHTLYLSHLNWTYAFDCYNRPTKKYKEQNIQYHVDYLLEVYREI